MSLTPQELYNLLISVPISEDEYKDIYLKYVGPITQNISPNITRSEVEQAVKGYAVSKDPLYGLKNGIPQAVFNFDWQNVFNPNSTLGLYLSNIGDDNTNIENYNQLLNNIFDDLLIRKKYIIYLYILEELMAVHEFNVRPFYQKFVKHLALYDIDFLKDLLLQRRLYPFIKKFRDTYIYYNPLQLLDYYKILLDSFTNTGITHIPLETMTPLFTLMNDDAYIFNQIINQQYLDEDQIISILSDITKYMIYDPDRKKKYDEMINLVLTLLNFYKERYNAVYNLYNSVNENSEFIFANLVKVATLDDMRRILNVYNPNFTYPQDRDVAIVLEQLPDNECLPALFRRFFLAAPHLFKNIDTAFTSFVVEILRRIVANNNELPCDMVYLEQILEVISSGKIWFKLNDEIAAELTDLLFEMKNTLKIDTEILTDLYDALGEYYETFNVQTRAIL